MSLPPSNAGLSQITVIVDLVIIVTLGMDGSLGGTVKKYNMLSLHIHVCVSLNSCHRHNLPKAFFAIIG